jgi:hypothetical protein
VNKRKKLMKAKLLLLILFLNGIAAAACPVCERQQPALLQGISHGTGPQSNWDYALVGATVILVLVTLFYSVKWLIKPGEAGDRHIKRAFLN